MANISHERELSIDAHLAQANSDAGHNTPCGLAGQRAVVSSPLVAQNFPMFTLLCRPGVRDLLIEYPEKYTYTHWTDNFTQNVSVNWQFDTSDALLERDDEITLHSIFEKHVRVLRNWTVSDEFAQLFPDLMPAIYSRD